MFPVLMDLSSIGEVSPRLIHHTNVKYILDASSLKEGTGKEICKLHDCVLTFTCIESLGS